MRDLLRTEILFSIKFVSNKVSVGFPVGLEVKNPPANAGDIRDVGLIPG